MPSLLGEKRDMLSSHDNTFWSKVGPVSNSMGVTESSTPVSVRMLLGAEA